MRPVVMSVSQATRLSVSSASTASRTASEIWSAILSGWPSVTDSEVKMTSPVKARSSRRLEQDEAVHAASALLVVAHGREDGVGVDTRRPQREPCAGQEVTRL